MSYISVNEWRSVSIVARSFSLAEKKVEELLREKRVPKARINGILCSDQGAIDTAVLEYISKQATAQTQRGAATSTRTKERSASEKWILLMGAYSLSLGGVRKNPLYREIVDNNWCSGDQIEKRVKDISQKMAQQFTDLNTNVTMEIKTKLGEGD